MWKRKRRTVRKLLRGEDCVCFTFPKKRKQLLLRAHPFFPFLRVYASGHCRPTEKASRVSTSKLTHTDTDTHKTRTHTLFAKVRLMFSPKLDGTRVDDDSTFLDNEVLMFTHRDTLSSQNWITRNVVGRAPEKRRGEGPKHVRFGFFLRHD